MLNPDFIPTPLFHRESRPPIEILAVRRPSRVRVVFLFYEMASLFLRLGILRLRRPFDAVAAGRLVRHYLEVLGGAWLKIGQLLALRSDLFSAAFCNELAKLHEQAYGFSPAASREIIEREFGAPFDEVFEEFDMAPIAAASLAQVHRAKLRASQTWVAVKVQKPMADGFFSYDLAWITVVFRCFMFFKLGRNFHWSDMLEELQGMILEELDYRYEAVAIRRLRKSVRRHGIYVPKVFEDLCTQHVLVMEYIDAVSVSEFIRAKHLDPERAEAWLRDNDITPALVSNRLLESLFRQMFEDNLVHGDLHPGNIMLLRHSRIAFLDFGTVGTYDRTLIGIFEQYLKALGTADFSKAADLMLRLYDNLPLINVYRIKRQFVAVMRNWHRRTEMTKLPFHKRSLSSSSDEIGKICIQYRFEANWTMLKLGRAYNTLDMTIGALYPRIQYPKAIRRYYERASRRATRARIRSLAELPGQIGDLMSVALPRIRESLLSFQSYPDSIARIAGGVLRFVRGLFFAGAIYLVMLFLRQHYRGASDALIPEGSEAAKHFDGVGRLDHTLWLWAFVILALGLWRFSRYIKNVCTPPQRMPGLTRGDR